MLEGFGGYVAFSASYTMNVMFLNGMPHVKLLIIKFFKVYLQVLCERLFKYPVWLVLNNYCF